MGIKYSLLSFHRSPEWAPGKGVSGNENSPDSYLCGGLITQTIASSTDLVEVAELNVISRERLVPLGIFVTISLKVKCLQIDTHSSSRATPTSQQICGQYSWEILPPES